MRIDEVIDEIIDETLEEVNTFKVRKYTKDEVIEILSFIIDMVGTSFYMKTNIQLPFVGKFLYAPKMPYQNEIASNYTKLQLLSNNFKLNIIPTHEVKDRVRRQENTKKMFTYYANIRKELTLLRKIRREGGVSATSFTWTDLVPYIKELKVVPMYTNTKELKQLVEKDERL